MQKAVPLEAVIFTNHPRLPLIRYWAERPAYFCPPMKVPPDGSADARWAMELSYNHLRELHHDRLPPIYYVYHSWFSTPEEAYSADSYLRFFLVGVFEPSEAGKRKAVEIIEEAVANGTSDRSFCPITGVTGGLLCFKLDPALPGIHQDFARMGYPSPAQFDRPP